MNRIAKLLIGLTLLIACDGLGQSTLLYNRNSLRLVNTNFWRSNLVAGANVTLSFDQYGRPVFSAVGGGSSWSNGAPVAYVDASIFTNLTMMTSYVAGLGLQSGSVNLTNWSSIATNLVAYHSVLLDATNSTISWVGSVLPSIAAGTNVIILTNQVNGRTVYTIHGTATGTGGGLTDAQVRTLITNDFLPVIYGLGTNSTNYATGISNQVVGLFPTLAPGSNMSISTNVAPDGKTTYTLSAVIGGGPSGILNLNGLTDGAQTFATADPLAYSFTSADGTHTLMINVAAPDAEAPAGLITGAMLQTLLAKPDSSYVDAATNAVHDWATNTFMPNVPIGPEASVMTVDGGVATWVEPPWALASDLTGKAGLADNNTFTGSNTFTGRVVVGDINSAAAMQRRLVVESSFASMDANVWVYKDFQTNSTLVEHVVLVPHGDFYYSGYHIRTNTTSKIPSLYAVTVGVPMWFNSNTNATKAGTWGISAHADNFEWYAYSATAGSTISMSLTGQVMAIRGPLASNGGYGLVSIDGSFTAANRLPKVTAELIAAGKFAAGDLGKAYIESYAASAVWDFVTIFADNLSQGPHAVVVTATGTKRDASSDARVYVGAFGVSSLGDTAFGNAGVYYVPLVKVCDYAVRVGTALGSVQSFTPTGHAGGWAGEVHSNERLVSLRFALDGLEVSLTNNQWISGAVASLERSSVLTNATAGDTCNRRDLILFDGTAQAQADWTTSYEWLTNGTASSYYVGMLMMSGNVADSSMTNSFTHFRVGTNVFSGAFVEQNYGLTATDWMGAWSTNHNFVAATWLPNLDSVLGFSYSDMKAFFYPKANQEYKFYFSRYSTNVAVRAGQVDVVRSGMRVVNIKNAASLLGNNGIENGDHFGGVTSKAASKTTPYAVGIGTNAPQAKLHVAGDARIDGAQTNLGTVSFGGGVNIGGTNIFDIFGSGSVNLSQVTNVFTNLLANVNELVAGTLTVLSNATFAGTVTAEAFYIGTTNILDLMGTSSASNVIVKAGTGVTISSNNVAGNVEFTVNADPSSNTNTSSASYTVSNRFNVLWHDAPYSQNTNVTFDLASGNNWRANLTNDAYFTFANVTGGQHGYVWMVQDEQTNTVHGSFVFNLINVVTNAAGAGLGVYTNGRAQTLFEYVSYETNVFLWRVDEGAVGGMTEAETASLTAVSNLAVNASVAVSNALTLGTLSVADNDTNFVVNLTNAYQVINVTTNMFFNSTTNRAAGVVRSTVIILECYGSTNRNLYFNAGWKWLGSTNNPPTVMSNEVCVLSLTSYGADETNTIAAFAAQP